MDEAEREVRIGADAWARGDAANEYDASGMALEYAKVKNIDGEHKPLKKLPLSRENKCDPELPCL